MKVRYPKRAARPSRGAALEKPEPTRIPAPGGVGSVNASPTGPVLYRWTGVLARSDSPSVYKLVEAGLVPVAHDTRYGSTLCMKAEELPARQMAAELVFGWGEEAP